MAGDRLVISNFLGFKETATYYLANRVAMAITFIQTPLSTVLLPELSARFDANQNIIPVFKKIFMMIFPSYLFLSILIIFFKDAILNLLTPSQNFQESSEIIPLLTIAYLFYGLLSTIGIILNVFKKVKFIIFLWFFLAIFNVILSYQLARTYQLNGVAFATTLTFFIGFILSGIYLIKNIQTVSSGRSEQLITTG
jgi:O-antigen/teichoic acid export membrane protein